MSNVRWRVIPGDCLEVLKPFRSELFDSVVTDPPAGIAFMGKEWDEDKGGRDHWIKWMTSVMAECLRVLKPGGHALVWALPRTSHWTSTAVENAGFEIRDVVTHHFGTGFPKSLDVSKAIDKAAGAVREVVGSRLGIPGVSKDGGNLANGFSRGLEGREDRPNAALDITAPSTASAKQWAGWGTALKPASEHWILARKPLIGTVAENVQTHGTGGINIDACRISSGSRPLRVNRPEVEATDIYGDGRGLGSLSAEGATSLGRFPANLVLSHSPDCGDMCADGCPIKELDQQSGITKSDTHVRKNTAKAHNKTASMGRSNEDWNTGGHVDTGGTSRFFYCAKPSPSEKNAAGENKHPTVKSVALMDYLIRLITPPGGIVFDPFCGSGTTGVAAVAGGWSFLGIEQDPDFADTACRRISHKEESQAT